jgi:predicted Zn finger-like uncharacterized protein
VIVSCPSCGTGFHLRRADAGEQAARARCSRCDAAFALPVARRAYRLEVPGMSPGWVPAMASGPDPARTQAIDRDQILRAMGPWPSEAAPSPREGAERAAAVPTRRAPHPVRGVVGGVLVGLALGYLAAPVMEMPSWIVTAAGGGAGLLLSSGWVLWRLSRV